MSIAVNRIRRVVSEPRSTRAGLENSETSREVSTEATELCKIVPRKTKEKETIDWKNINISRNSVGRVFR